MNDEPTLQTIALQVDCVINRLDSVGDGMAVFESSLGDSKLAFVIWRQALAGSRPALTVSMQRACNGSRHSFPLSRRGRSARLAAQNEQFS
jgi:hypothetical protein